MSRNDRHRAVEAALAGLEIETPSWGYGDSGTRFAVFQQAGRPRDVFERLDDAAEVHRLTGAAPAVALHFPWDQVDDLSALRAHADSVGLRIGAVNPNLFQDADYMLGSITHPGRRRSAPRRWRTCSSAWRSRASSAPRRSRCGSPTARTTPARTTCARAAGACSSRSQEVYAALPAEQELLVEYKFFEPGFYATDLADWGSSLLICQKLGERAKVLVDMGHHAQGTNIEQIVAILDEEGRLGGFHFNNRKYADDDLIVGSVNPFELFLVFCELTAAGRPLPRLTIDQSHNVEPKVEAMVLSVVNIQEAYAKALLVDREALAAYQADGDVLGGHEVLLDAFRTDVRPLCARVRAAKGAPEDPVRALRESGYAQRVASERGGSVTTAGGWGR